LCPDHDFVSFSVASSVRLPVIRRHHAMVDARSELALYCRRPAAIMIDLHSHILPGIDDGATARDVSIAMAKAWVADGVSIVACTPHILPSLYHNSGPQIREAVASLQATLDAEGVPLRLVTGADNHIVPDFVAGLKSGHLLSIADTRYVLVEPPHHVAPQRMDELFFGIQAAGYVPILTHPERLSWLPQHYDSVKQLIHNGVWMQITAGSLTGAFGRTPLYWATRMLDEGGVHILASDAHDVSSRPPRLSEGFYAAAKRVGETEAANLVLNRPRGILENALPSDIPAPAGMTEVSEVTNVDGPGTRRADRLAPQGSAGDSSRGFSNRLWSLFK